MEAGRIRSYSSPRAVLHYAVLLDQYRDCMVMASPLLRGLITALAPLGRRLGFGRPERHPARGRWQCCRSQVRLDAGRPEASSTRLSARLSVVVDCVYCSDPGGHVSAAPDVLDS